MLLNRFEPTVFLLSLFRLENYWVWNNEILPKWALLCRFAGGRAPLSIAIRKENRSNNLPKWVNSLWHTFKRCTVTERHHFSGLSFFPTHNKTQTTDRWMFSFHLSQCWAFTHKQPFWGAACDSATKWTTSWSLIIYLVILNFNIISFLYCFWFCNFLLWNFLWWKIKHSIDSPVTE